MLIGDLNSDGPAAAAGLMRGDVIVSLDGQPVKDVTSFRNRVAMIQPDTTVNLEVLRGGDRQEIAVKIGSLSGEVTADATGQKTLESKWGMRVQTIDPQLAEQLKVEPNGGVVVTTVDPNSPAAAAGIRPGTIIRQVNRQDVADAAAFARAIGESHDADSLLLLVERENRTQYVVVKKAH